MIFGLEIALTLLGLTMLVRGKGWGSGAVKHPYYRLLGVFLLTLVPVVIAAAFMLAVVWAVLHPGIDDAALQQDLRWPGVGLELGLVVIYCVIGTLWDKSIRRKVAAESAPAGGAP